MITLLYAFIIVSLMAAPLLLLGYADRRHHRRSQGKLLRQFQQEGATYGLHITSQELLPQAVVGVDGQQRKLLVAWKDADDLYRSRVIDLTRLANCAVVEDLHTHTDGSFFGHNPEVVVDRVVLQLETPAWPPTGIPFYDASLQGRPMLPRMRQKACKWKAIVAQLMPDSTAAGWVAAERKTTKS